MGTWKMCNAVRHRGSWLYTLACHVRGLPLILCCSCFQGEEFSSVYGKQKATPKAPLPLRYDVGNGNSGKRDAVSFSLTPSFPCVIHSGHHPFSSSLFLRLYLIPSYIRKLATTRPFFFATFLFRIPEGTNISQHSLISLLSRYTRNSEDIARLYRAGCMNTLMCKKCRSISISESNHRACFCLYDWRSKFPESTKHRKKNEIFQINNHFANPTEFPFVR